MKFLGIPSRTVAALCATVSVIGAASAQQSSQGTTEYWMTADTASGMAAMMGGGAMGGGRPDPGAMMRMMMGGGRGEPSHLLNLRLASPTAAANPEAEHVPPAGLRAGNSLPLVTPPASRREETPSMLPQGMERPRGRILIYWGCGEHARAGQPVVVDFAQLSAGQIPPAFANTGASGVHLPGPNSRPGYGEWPNPRSQTAVPGSGSLVGAHVVRGNYSPEIAFTLTQQQDFLAPVELTSNEPNSSGAVPLAWAPVPGSRAWLATVMGGTRSGDVVMWSSSETQALPMALGMGHFSDADLAGMVRDRVLLPAETTRCAVPAEVVGAGEGAMLSLTAFGGEATFSHPARPAGAPASWRPEWTVTLLRKSSHMSLLGMDMAAMMR